ncbi:C-type lectin domain containing ema [Dermatophagoides farinae]|uniref:C-type lectin domain containing ema n=1 Tax=Dermatophagoides farinae TaxID=6954 RepID=UPI003F60A5D7
MLRPTKWFGWSRSSSESSLVRSNGNPHSLEQLKLLYRLLEKNQTVSESNRTLLVETLRQIAEILIWGDQNDSSVFDFFLEKNMLYFFLNIMKQKCGGYVCTQLLQTLNILFENIKNETSLYYLLSNNHVNSIIIHKFDFSDEEVMAYYISFLKTLSLKLNTHTIHFFFNEHTADFPLYTEAIKFFNHSEKMVRIAVRTLTLNVFRVQEKAMLRFIRDCTAAPYFSNLSWFIGNHILDLNSSLATYIESRNQSSSSSNIQGSLPHSNSSSNLINRLEDLVAEHLDHLHYLNDILLLDIDDLNNVLSDNLLYRLIIPLYMHSFLRIDSKFKSETSNSKEINVILSPSIAIFLLTQVFLIISYGALLKTLLLALISNKQDIETIAQKCEFTQPITSLEAAIEQAIQTTSNQNSSDSSEMLDSSPSHSINNNDNNEQLAEETVNNFDPNHSTSDENKSKIESCPAINWQDCSFLITLLASLNAKIIPNSESSMDNNNRNSNSSSSSSKNSERNNLSKSCHSSQIIRFIPDWTSSDDRIVLFSLSLISSIVSNKAIDSETYENIFLSSLNDDTSLPPTNSFHHTLINSLLLIMRQCSSSNSSIRLVTFELAVHLFRKLACCPLSSNVVNPPEESQATSRPHGHVILSDHQIAVLEQAREDACHILRHYYCSIDESIFLNLFEKEARMFHSHSCSTRTSISSSTSASPSKHSASDRSNQIWSYDSYLTLEQLFMDATLLLPPNEINKDDSNFHLRLPGIDCEKARYIIQVFFVLRLLSFDVRKSMGDTSTDDKAQDFSILLDDTITSPSVYLDQFIDLENCDLNRCSVTFYQLVNNQHRQYSGDARDRYSQSAPASRSESPSLMQNSNTSGRRMQRFMTIMNDLIILIEPDDKRYGWGVIRFIARLQDIEKIVMHSKELGHLQTSPPLPEKDNNKSLYIYFDSYRLSSSIALDNKMTITRIGYRNRQQSIVARFQFNDTVRSLVARNNLCKAHKKVLDRKIIAVANLIDVPTSGQTTVSQSIIRTGSSSKSSLDSNKKATNQNHHNHPILTRTYAVPGVAVPSKFPVGQSSDSSSNDNNTNKLDMLNKKRYAYSPAVSNNKTNKSISSNRQQQTSAKISIENERRLKKKLKYPANHLDNDHDQEQYGIPLNDLSPKTLRKNTSSTITAVSAAASVTLAAEWQENSNNSHLFNDTHIEEGINPLDNNNHDVVDAISLDNLNVTRMINNDINETIITANNNNNNNNNKNNRSSPPSSSSSSSSSLSSLRRQQNRTSETFDV